VLLNLVAKVDRVLILTAEQRDQLTEVLQTNWNDAWNQLQMLMYGEQYFPLMPDAKILPLLTATQKAVWRGIPKGQVHFGFDLGMMHGIDVGEEEWGAEAKEPTKPAEKK
jgi:hypothetical protein